MSKYKYIAIISTFLALFLGAAPALAYPTSYLFTYTDSDLGPGSNATIPTPAIPNTGSFFFLDGTASSVPEFVGIAAGSGLAIDGSNNLTTFDMPASHWTYNGMTGYDTLNTLFASTSAEQTQINSLSSSALLS